MSIKVTILGCGSSLGVPRADGFYGNCDPKEKKNFRTRCSIIIKTNNQNTLIDTSPDLKSQLILMYEKKNRSKSQNLHKNRLKNLKLRMPLTKLL